MKAAASAILRSRSRLLDEFHQLFAPLRVGQHLRRDHGRIAAEAIVEIRQQHEITAIGQALPHLPHDRADAETVHEEDHGGPGTLAGGGGEDGCRTGSVAGLDGDIGAGHGRVPFAQSITTASLLWDPPAFLGEESRSTKGREIKVTIIINLKSLI